MAASAYAFLVSLTNTIDQIQLHPFTSTCFDNFQFESLRKKVNFLLDFVENHAHDEEGEDLLSRIAAVAQKAEDIIEVEAADRIRGRSTEISSNFLPDLQEKTEEMDRIINEDVMIKVKEEGMSRSHDEHPPPASSSMALPPPSSAPPPSTAMVGFDGYMNKLLDELNGYHSGRQILPIVGMGGVGKTTLARNVYGNPLMVESFNVRLWVTVSQTYSASDVFLQALACLGKSYSATTDDDELGKELRKALYDRRYLVVLDDMWSVEAWEKIKFYFPDNNNRSRIVVTTREQKLVAYFGSSSSSSSSSSAVAVGLLDKENSWKLFCGKTFSKGGGCPPQLEAIGRKIVRKCRGLPLAIDLMGGLLRRSPGTQEYWEKIEQDKSLILEYSGESNKPLSILYLSYKHLPVCFMPCFLYLGLFPEDYRIDVSELIRLWIGEGFIKPKANLTLEEVAGSYVKELVDRNLILVGDLRLYKKFRTCFLHDLVRELCIRIADEENFYCVQRDMAGECHLIVDPTTAKSHPTSLYHPLLFQGERASAPFKSRLLRVLVSPLIRGAGEEVNLRLLSDYNRNHDYMSKIVLPPKLPSSISLFWSLQTILFHKTLNGVLLPDIWKMPQLRHVEVSPLRLPEPPPTGGDAVVLRNLQTLKRVWNLNLSEEVCKRIPEIKELGIRYISQGQEDWDESVRFNLQNVGCLNKLESLRCSFMRAVALKNLTLPNSLKELSLCRCLLPWSYMAIIGLLPRLQILHLLERAMVGAEWNLCEDEEEEEEEKFISLKYLRIEKCDDLIRWDADASNFPVLETLCLKKLSKLEEIPSGIGDIPTLERMYVHGCSGTAAMSAIRILEEQESLENLDLRLDIRFFEWSEARMLKGKVQELGIRCRNLQIS